MVTLVESDWPMVSVTVSWNLYTPDVRFETIIWSSKVVFYKAWNIKTHRHMITNSSGGFFLNLPKTGLSVELWQDQF